MTDRLVILNLPHPNGLRRELRNNPQQHENSSYARAFQEKEADAPDVFFGRPMTPQTLSGWVSDPGARERYVEAFERSDFTAMLNYYKANYPRIAPGADPPPSPTLPRAKMPVLMFHGLDDRALLPAGLNDTWEWLEKDLTLVTIPGAGHFVQAGRQRARDEDHAVVAGSRPLTRGQPEWSTGQYRQMLRRPPTNRAPLPGRV